VCSDSIVSYRLHDINRNMVLEGEVSGMKRLIAKLLKFLGFKPSVSTGIHGYITYGYGKLSFNGFWQFPLDDGEYVG